MTSITPPRKTRVKYAQPDCDQMQLTEFGVPDPPERRTLVLWLETDLIMEFIQKAVKPNHSDIVKAVEELMRKAVEEKKLDGTC